MPGQAAKVIISERQQVVLRELSRSRTQSRSQAVRASIVLLAFEGQLNRDIAKELQIGVDQVGLWRRRWQRSWESLTKLECLETHRLRAAIREVFTDAPRSGRKSGFTGAQITEILAVACEPPAKSGLPITHWTNRDLRTEILKRQIVADISESYVGKLLRRAALQPHRRKMWLHKKEKDPEVFKQQVQEVCNTYLEAPQLAAERGVHTLSIDEMTGLQALERNAPSQAMQPNQPVRDEYEYTRHGTTTLIGNLDVVTGKVVSPSIGPTRTEADFATHICQTVSSDPTGNWVFIVDNLNIHLSAQLVILIALICGVRDHLGTKNKSGVLHNLKSRREFLSSKEHRIRFVYLPKHSSWLNQIETVFGVINRKAIRRGNFTSVSDLETKLWQFIKYYNDTMAHPFDWTYTGKPMHRRQRLEFCPHHRRRSLSNVELAKLALSSRRNLELSD